MRQQNLPSQIFRWNLAAATLCAAALLLIGSGCTPQIGDACESQQDCPNSDFDTICDTSVDGGLCTIADCRPGECPSESICVEFARHESYCLRSCDSDDECRSDHSCIDDDDADARYCFADD